MSKTMRDLGEYPEHPLVREQAKEKLALTKRLVLTSEVDHDLFTADFVRRIFTLMEEAGLCLPL